MFLELGIKNMLQYLAFDIKAIKSLLDDQNEEHFSPDFPVFYKNENGTSALDVCIGHNQIRSLNLIVEYMSKY